MPFESLCNERFRPDTYQRAKLGRWRSFLVVFALLSTVANAQKGRDSDPLLDAYVRTSGEDQELVAKMRSDAIPRLVQRLKNETDPTRRASLLIALSKAVDQIPAEKAIKDAGRTTIYDSLKSRDANERRLAVRCVGKMDKGLATAALLQMVNDTNETVRVAAIQALADYGSPTSASLLEQALKDRARGLSAEEMKKDYSFKFGPPAIDRLRARAKNPKATFPPIAEPKLEPLSKPEGVQVPEQGESD